MKRVKRGPKSTKSSWAGVYDQPKVKGGPTRWVFWDGKGKKTLVRGNDLTSQSFRVAYARFVAGLPPYEDSVARPQKRSRSPESPSGATYGHGTVGWLLTAYMATDKFKRQKNKRAIEGQFHWIMTQPVRRENPEGPKIGCLPLAKFDAVGIEKLLARKVKTVEIKKLDRSGRKEKTVIKTTGDQQANNIRKWLRPVGKIAVREKFWTTNQIDLVEPYRVKGEGYRMWTDEVWDKVCNEYPLGTKPRLVFDLAGFTGQRRGDVYVLGWHTEACTHLPPDDECPFGSFEIRQEKGDEDDGDPQVAYVPIVDELHASLEAARRKGILGSQFFIRKDHKDEPYVKESLTNAVRKWLRAIGIEGYSLHGLRKLFVCRLIERDCPPHMVMAATGHTTLKQIDNYAKKYFRSKMKGGLYARWRKHALQQGIPLGANRDANDDGLNEAA